MHSDVASAAGPQLLRILSRSTMSALLPYSLSAPFPQHLRSLSALFPRSLRTVAAVLLQELQYSYIHSRAFLLFMQVHLSERTVAETLSDQRVMYKVPAVVKKPVG